MLFVEDEHPEELLGNASLDDTFVDVAIDAEVVFGIVGLLPLEVDELEVSGFVDEDGPGAVPTFGAGIFWQFGGSYASTNKKKNTSN